MRKSEHPPPPIVLDTVDQCLRLGTRSVHLTPRAFAVLRHLAEHPRRLVTKDELLKTVWAGTVVTDGVLKVCIREIRKALDEDAHAPDYIETVHRRGYRFLREIEWREGPSLGVSNAESRSSQTASEPASDEIVGREAILERLDGHLERALAGERQLVFLAGPPGIGKTSVADVFTRRAGAAQTLLAARGQCIEHYGAGEAYMPLLEALGRLARGRARARTAAWLSRYAPTWLSALGLAPEALERERLERELLGATRERMLREIAEALEALSAEVPLVLVLEDLHWSDYSTLDFLALLGRRREPARLLLLGTYRPVDALRSSHPLRSVLSELAAQHLCSEIALERLDEPAVAAYLERRFRGHGFPPELAAALQRRTEGHPFFLLHAVGFLVQSGALEPPGPRGKTWRFEGDLSGLATLVPEGVRQAIEVEIGRLEPPDQTLLEAASCVGLEFSAAAVAGALEQDLLAVEERCDALVARQQFLRPSGLREFPDGSLSARYAFQHALQSSVLYHRLPAARRARLHARIGRRGEELYGERVPAIAAELARHFEEGRDLVRAVHYLRAAAENDARRHANREAAAHLEHALALIAHLSEPDGSALTLAVLEELGLLRRSMGDITAALQAFEALVQNAEETGARETRVRGLLTLASVLFWVDHEGCLAAAERAVELAGELSDELLLAHARGYWGHWNLNLCAFRAEHVRACEQALETCRRLGDKRLLSLHTVRFAYAQCLQGEYVPALRTAEEATRLSLEAGDGFDHLLGHFFRGWALLHAGRFGELQQSLESAIAMAERNGHRPWATLFRIELAQLRVELFDFESARSLAEAAVDEARRTAEPTGQILLHGSIALAAAKLGLADVAGAENALEEIQALRADRRRRLDRFLEPLRLNLAGQLALERGDFARARREALELVELAAKSGEVTYLALGKRTLAEAARRAGDAGEATEHFKAALSALEQKRAPLAAWRVLASLYEFELGERRPREAELYRARSGAVLRELVDSLPEGAAREGFASHRTVRPLLAGDARTRAETAASASPSKDGRSSAPRKRRVAGAPER